MAALNVRLWTWRDCAAMRHDAGVCEALGFVRGLVAAIVIVYGNVNMNVRADLNVNVNCQSNGNAIVNHRCTGGAARFGAKTAKVSFLLTVNVSTVHVMTSQYLIKHTFLKLYIKLPNELTIHYRVQYIRHSCT